VSSATIAPPVVDRSSERKQRRQRPVLWALSAVAVTVVVVNLVVVLLEPYMLYIVRYDQQHTSARIVEYLQAPSPDVMFMGTSRALSGFDPNVVEQEIQSLTGTKISAHNMALTGGTIEIHYLILKNIVRDDKKPKVIVYGLTDSEFYPIPSVRWTISRTLTSCFGRTISGNSPARRLKPKSPSWPSKYSHSIETGAS